MDFIKKPWFLCLVITVFILIVYLPTMNTYLMGDDFEWLDSAYRGWTHPGQLLELINNFFRPMIKLTYLFNYTLFNTNALFYNIFTVLLHLLNVVMLFIWIFKITQKVLIAGSVALTFGISAMYSEVTLWSAARTETVLLIFMLTVFILLDKAGEKISISRHIAILFFGIMAAASKETWILLPFLAFAFIWIVKDSSFKTALKNSSGLYVLLILYAGYFIIGPMLTGKKSPTAYASLDILNIIKKFGYMMYRYTGFGDSFTGAVWQFVVLFIVLAGVLWWIIYRKNRLAGYGFTWLMIMVGISLPIYYAPSRYNYFPLIGFWIMIVALTADGVPLILEKYKIKKTIAIGTIILVLALYITQQVIMIQVEIKDYRIRGELHKTVVNLYNRVKNQIPKDKPLVFMDFGTYRAVDVTVASMRGYPKLLFVRQKAIWQQVFLSPLANFAGEPFKRLMEPIPTKEIDNYLQNDFAILVFTDLGFFIPTSPTYREKLLKYYRTYRQLPNKVELLRFIPAG